MSEKVVVVCTHCSAKMAVKGANSLGKKVRCPKCTEIFIAALPGVVAAAAAPPRPSAPPRVHAAPPAPVAVPEQDEDDWLNHDDHEQDFANAAAPQPNFDQDEGFDDSEADQDFDAPESDFDAEDEHAAGTRPSVASPRRKRGSMVPILVGSFGGFLAFLLVAGGLMYFDVLDPNAYGLGSYFGKSGQQSMAGSNTRNPMQSGQPNRMPISPVTPPAKNPADGDATEDKPAVAQTPTNNVDQDFVDAMEDDTDDDQVAKNDPPMASVGEDDDQQPEITPPKRNPSAVKPAPRESAPPNKTRPEQAVAALNGEWLPANANVVVSVRVGELLQSKLAAPLLQHPEAQAPLMLLQQLGMTTDDLQSLTIGMNIPAEMGPAALASAPPAVAILRLAKDVSLDDLAAVIPDAERLSFQDQDLLEFTVGNPAAASMPAAGMSAPTTPEMEGSEEAAEPAEGDEPAAADSPAPAGLPAAGRKMAIFLASPTVLVIGESGPVFAAIEAGPGDANRPAFAAIDARQHVAFGVAIEDRSPLQALPETAPLPIPGVGQLLGVIRNSLQGVGIGIKLHDGFDLQVQLDCGAAQPAKQAQTALTSLIAFGKQWFDTGKDGLEPIVAELGQPLIDSLAAKTNGSVTTLSATLPELTEEHVQQFVQMVAAQSRFGGTPGAGPQEFAPLESMDPSDGQMGGLEMPQQPRVDVDQPPQASEFMTYVVAFENPNADADAPKMIHFGIMQMIDTKKIDPELAQPICVGNLEFTSVVAANGVANLASGSILSPYSVINLSSLMTPAMVGGSSFNAEESVTGFEEVQGTFRWLGGTLVEDVEWPNALANPGEIPDNDAVRDAGLTVELENLSEEDMVRVTITVNEGYALSQVLAMHPNDRGGQPMYHLQNVQTETKVDGNRVTQILTIPAKDHEQLNLHLKLFKDVTWNDATFSVNDVKLPAQ